MQKNQDKDILIAKLKAVVALQRNIINDFDYEKGILLSDIAELSYDVRRLNSKLTKVQQINKSLCKKLKLETVE